MLNLFFIVQSREQRPVTSWADTLLLLSDGPWVGITGTLL